MVGVLLVLTKELAERIRAHGDGDSPHECCGALLGGGVQDNGQREIWDYSRLSIADDDSPQNPTCPARRQDVLDAEKSERKQGLDVVGWITRTRIILRVRASKDRDHAWTWSAYIIRQSRARSADRI